MLCTCATHICCVYTVYAVCYTVCMRAVCAVRCPVLYTVLTDSPSVRGRCRARSIRSVRRRPLPAVLRQARFALVQAVLPPTAFPAFRAVTLSQRVFGRVRCATHGIIDICALYIHIVHCICGACALVCAMHNGWCCMRVICVLYAQCMRNVCVLYALYQMRRIYAVPQRGCVYICGIHSGYTRIYACICAYMRLACFPIFSAQNTCSCSSTQCNGRLPTLRRANTYRAGRPRRFQADPCRICGY